MSGADTNLSVEEWKKSPDGHEWASELMNPVENNKVIVVMLQEVDEGGKFGDFLEQTIKELGVHPYKMFRTKNVSFARYLDQHFSQHLYVFIPENLTGSYSVSQSFSTCFGKLKTCVKGTIGRFIQLRFSENEKVNMMFLCSHFPFEDYGPKGQKKRRDAYDLTKKHIVDKAIIKLNKKYGATENNTTVIWGGDMNFRNSALPGKDAEVAATIVRPNATWDDLKGLVVDELGRRADAKAPFPETSWRGGITIPTCKMTQTFDKERGDFRQFYEARQFGVLSAYVPTRIPSHCDRVFTRNLEAILGRRTHSETLTKLSRVSTLSDHDALRVVYDIPA